MLELQNKIKEYLSYYNDLPVMQKQIEDIQLDMNQRNLFESILQRYLSQIIDGIVFFYSHPNFHSQKQLFNDYVKLKKKMLQVIKSFLQKIFNKEYNFINKNFQDIFQGKQVDILEQYAQFIRFDARADKKEEVFASIEEHPSNERLVNLIIVFPQFKHILMQDINQSSVPVEIIDTESFDLNQILRNLISFLETEAGKDAEIQAVYQDVFIKYFLYCRLSVHKELINLISQSQKKKQNLLRRTIFYTFEVLCFEHMYTQYCLNFSRNSLLEEIKPHFHKILDSYYEFARQAILKENQVEQLMENMDLVLSLTNNLPKTLKTIQGQSTIYNQITKVSPGELMMSQFTELAALLLEKIKQDI